jgi:phosphoribosylanthranilate isomerase
VTWVKICGLTRREDVIASVEAGADAIGFVAAPSSPRFVSLEEAAALGSNVAALRVLVTVDLEPDNVVATVRRAGVDGLQPHGRHAAKAAATAAAAGMFVLQPIAVHPGIRPSFDSAVARAIPLLDTHLPEQHGGTGRVFDWSLATGLSRRFVLAGGLDSANIRRAISAVVPWGVDASTGLEAAPGIKDPGRVEAFIAAAKEL